MPCDAIIVDEPEFPIDIQVLEEMDGAAQEAAASSAAPRTPKRNVEHDGHERRTTPTKIAKQREDDEPSNRDIMLFLRQMQLSQDAALHSVNTRLGDTERRLANMEETTSARMNALENKMDTLELAEGGDVAARDRLDKLEKSVTTQMMTMGKRLEDYAKKAAAAAAATNTSAAASSSASTPASVSQARTQLFDGTVVIVGGFPQETPRTPMEQAWTSKIKPLVEPHMDLRGMYIEAPFLLSSALQARCASASQARQLVATIRRLSPVIPFGQVSVNLYATLQKPKEIKEKNKMLLKATENMQKHLHPSVPAQPPYKCICWKSSTIVIQDRRVCRVTRSDDGKFTFDFVPNWFSAQTFNSAEEIVRKSVTDLVDSEGVPTE